MAAQGQQHALGTTTPNDGLGTLRRPFDDAALTGSCCPTAAPEIGLMCGNLVPIGVVVSASVPIPDVTTNVRQTARHEGRRRLLSSRVAVALVDHVKRSSARSES